MSGCINEKDYTKNAIDPSLIIGSWFESYDIYPYFSSDSGSTYTFNKDGTYLLELYHVDQEGESFTCSYTIYDGAMTTVTQHGSTDYKIVHLDKDIMEWQKVDTEFSEGTLHNEYKRFKRKK